MESLAFNIMARVDDVLYADDSIRQSAAEVSKPFMSVRPVQKPMSPSPFSIQQTPYASPLTSPKFGSSTPTSESPERTSSFRRKDKEARHVKSAKSLAADFEKVWSYADNVASRRVTADAPERD